VCRASPQPAAPFLRTRNIVAGDFAVSAMVCRRMKSDGCMPLSSLCAKSCSDRENVCPRPATRRACVLWPVRVEQPLSSAAACPSVCVKDCVTDSRCLPSFESICARDGIGARISSAERGGATAAVASPGAARPFHREGDIAKHSQCHTSHASAEHIPQHLTRFGDGAATPCETAGGSVSVCDVVCALRWQAAVRVVL
jgi:hypothetical protein